MDLYFFNFNARMFLSTAFDTIISRNPILSRTWTFALVLLTLFNSGCVGTKYLETNQSLVIHKPVVEGISSDDRSELIDLAVQQPNKRLFGFLPITYLVYAHQIGLKHFDPEKKQKKINRVTAKYDTKIQKSSSQKRKDALLNKKTNKVDELRIKKEEGNWLMTLGEPLAIFDTSRISLTLDRFQTYLRTHGYFLADINYQIMVKNERKKYLKYTINPGPQYVIDSIEWQVADSAVLSLIHEHSSQSLVKKGATYNQQTLETERNRIYDLMTNTGYYTFSRQFIGFEVDTFSLSDHKILLRQRISNPAGDSHRKYVLDSINFYSSTSPSETKLVSNYLGITYHFGERNYNPKVLRNRIFLEADSLYSRANTIKTQRQLSYLDAFRFVNINYDSISNYELIANIFTSPLNRYQTSAELGAIAISQQFPGPFINLGLKNRNTFHSLETIDLLGNFSVQGISGVGTETSAYSLFQLGGSASLTYPKFLFPLSDAFRRRVASYNPQTRIRFSYNYEDRANEYERSRAELNYSFLWSVQERSQFNFTPVTFTFIDVRNLTTDFELLLDEQLLNGNGALKAAFNSSVISSSSFEMVHNIIPRRSSGENSFIRLFVETGGNLVNLVGEEFFLRNDRVDADEFTLFKWTKFNTDYRRVYALNNGAHLAYRVNFGVAYPYGKDPSLPYEKRFYIGGSNSLRAWQVRRLGPGSFGEFKSDANDTQSVAIVDYQLERGGDMILESSIEYRKKLVGFIDYAFFVDAGNIWLINSNINQVDDQGDDGFFHFNSFIKEIAIGAGMGLRLDFSFFVFRLDGALQVMDPAQPLGNRWVLDDIPIGKIGRMSEIERDIFRSKTNLTIGIGLPF